ncbi:MAG: 2-oxo acid dehydrogenase subunit E2 [Calditrichaceae bacterium]|nr:2-oxo acid dehydrogenase subunit E2 [Calditrichaceae bacterium]MBN2709706.1 2-oxo acid dehydrogenase subunit E2 [Calditrichaceae bacterium]RQV92547.1 MAG: 2-oxo acid dehydrogenase subunit E2 [Calditrichota bacterium]
MKLEMVMPKMGESITEGVIVKWLKAAGDTVENDEIILEISTDKVDSEIPTPAAGKIIELLAGEGETVEVGKPIAVIETDHVTYTKKSAEIVAGQNEPVSQPVKQPTLNKSIQFKKSNRFYSPVVMNMASQHNLSMEILESLPGSGSGGRLTKKDLLAYLNSDTQSKSQTSVSDTVQKPAGDMVEILPMDHIRKRIAEHMIHSIKTSAQVALYTEVDMLNIHKIREANNEIFKAREGFGLTYLPFVVEAAVQALKEFPLLNARIDGDNILINKFYNIGIAVAVENGLIVPNIFHCEELNLTGIARAINDLAVRARNKKLNPDELTGGTFSVSNFGLYGVTAGFPIINQPQSAILGVGAVKKRPVVIDDAIAIRPVMHLSLTIDHRLIDGAMGSQFLQRIAGLLENYDITQKP